MSFGVLGTGFSQKSLQDILDSIEAAEQAAYGTGINTTATSVLGQLNGIMAAELAELWAAATAIYRAQYPDTASGDALDGVSSITGVTRLAATKSTVVLSVNLDAGVQLLPGRVVSDSAGNRYATTELAENTNAYSTNVQVDAESEEFGPIFSAAQDIETIETPVTGWTAQAAIDSGNPEVFSLSDGQTLTIKVDGEVSAQTATFNTGDFVDIGNALAAEVAAVIATDITGVTAVDAGGYVRIESDTDGAGSKLEVTGGTANTALGFDTSPVKGLNALDSVPGTNLETDAALRLRRQQLLRAQGESTVEAILADILEVTGVEDAAVFENDSDSTDGDGRPPHSIEVVILGADPDTDLDDRVAEEIFNSKAAAIQTYRVGGANGRTETVTDSQGFTHSINFNRADAIEIYIIIDVDVNSSQYPTTGDDDIKEALVELGSSLSIGDDVVAERIKCEAFQISGVVDITNFKIGIVSPPTLDANITIDPREVSAFDTSRITVNSTPI